MSNQFYMPMDGINEVQTNIMRFIDSWAREEKAPVTLQKVLSEMIDRGVKKPTIMNSLSVLIKKGYIRRGYAFSRTTTYIQIRTVRQ